MNIVKSITTATVFMSLSVGGMCASASPMVASVAIDNLSDHSIGVFCTVNKDTQFYHQPNVAARYLTIAAADAPSVDIERIVEASNINIATENPDLVCVDTTDSDSWFHYTMVMPYDESVQVHGEFHYDPSYTGSITFGLLNQRQ